MMASHSTTIAFAILLVGAGTAVWDVMRIERSTVVIYTTAALRDVLEKGLIPAFERAQGVRVAPIYIPAGEQYNRLRMSGERSDADLFLHSSPLYLEQGYAEGHVDATTPTTRELNDTFHSRSVPGGQIWTSFAWSPLVQVHRADAPNDSDLATTQSRFGFPDPLLSNNGVYAVLLVQHVGGDVGAHLLSHTRVQPTNGQANIGGVADGSFDLTLGYEAVVTFYQKQGAPVAYELPIVHGTRVTTPVIFSVAMIHGGERKPGATAFERFLFTPEAQALVVKAGFRSIDPNASAPAGAIDINGQTVDSFGYDWSQWSTLAQDLPRYQVKG